MLTIYEAKAKHEQELLKTPGLVGVGLSGNQIIIYVEDASIAVPALLEGYKTYKKVVGKVKAL